MTDHAREAAAEIIMLDYRTLKRHPEAPREIIQSAIDSATSDLRNNVDELNNLLRHVGWGQGEIDSAATVVEEHERLRAAYDAALCALEASDRKRRELEDRVMELEAFVKNYYPR